MNKTRRRARPVTPWDGFISRVDLSRLPCKVDLEVRRRDLVDAYLLLVTMHVKDIYSDARSPVHHLWELPPFERMDDAQRLKAVRCAITAAFRHEIDECLWLDGARVFDPHADDRFHALAGTTMAELR